MNTSEYWQMPTNVIVQNNRLFFKSSEGLLGFFFFLISEKKSILVDNIISCIKCMFYSNSTKVLKIAFLNKFNTMCWLHFSQLISLKFRSAVHFFLFIISLMCTHSQTTLTQSLFLSLLLSFWKSFITSFYNTTRFKCLAFYNFLRLMWEIWGDIQRGMLIKD